MDHTGEDLCLTFAQESVYLAQEAELISSGNYGQLCTDNLESIIENYFELCSLSKKRIRALN